MDATDSSDVLGDDFLFYSHIYSIVTVAFAMGVLSKFLTNDFDFGIRSFITLFVLFVGEPVCHLLLRGPTGLALFTLGCVLVYKSLPCSHLTKAGKAVLVTGCDSGFGYATAKKLDALGVTVFACCLSPDGPGAKELVSTCSDRMHILQLDVRNDKNLSEAFEIVSRAVEDTGLWGLVNNAGVFYIAEIEMMSEAMFRKILDINLFGTIRVTKTFLPLIRRTQGRVVNVSSCAGRISYEGCGAYTVSKFGIEAYSDVLRLEMNKWKVKVSVVEPAGFRTSVGDEEGLKRLSDEIWANMDPSARSLYGREYLDRMYSNFSAVMSSCPSDVSPVVSAVCAGLFSKSPSARYPAGRGAGFLLAIYPFLPSFLADKIARMCASTTFMESDKHPHDDASSKVS